MHGILTAIGSGATALHLGHLATPPRALVAPRSRALDLTMVDSWYDSGARLTVVPEGYVEVEPDGSCPVIEETYYCNESGCWIGTPPPVAPVILPDGRTFCMDVGVQSHKSKIADEVAKRRPAETGIFAPVVKGAKSVMGEKELMKLRGDVIAQHSAVISAFVDTSESPFGQLVLKQLFEAADKDGNGTLDREEIKEALFALGFTFIDDKNLDKVFERADSNDDLVIDFEEFVQEAPTTLRRSLIKMAKMNGHDLGFLA